MAIVSADIVIMTVRDGRLMTGLVRRDHAPHEGCYALPGVFIGETETAEDAARRAARDKAGIALSHIEQLRTFSGPGRDPRGWSLSVAHLALVRRVEDSEAVRFVPAIEAADTGLPFDHADIVAAAVERVRGKSSYSTLPAAFLPEEFTAPELQSVYEAVTGRPLNGSVFRRNLSRMIGSGVITETGGMRPGSRDARRPAKLYRSNGVMIQDAPIV